MDCTGSSCRSSCRRPKFPGEMRTSRPSVWEQRDTFSYLISHLQPGLLARSHRAPSAPVLRQGTNPPATPLQDSANTAEQNKSKIPGCHVLEVLNECILTIPLWVCVGAVWLSLLRVTVTTATLFVVRNYGNDPALPRPRMLCKWAAMDGNLNIHHFWIFLFSF